MSRGNMLLGYARGKVGDVVFSRRLGQQVARSYNARPNNPKTQKQIEHRVKLANLVVLYKVGHQLTAESFVKTTTGKKSRKGRTSYNGLVSSNLPAARVAFTKEQASVGACVLDNQVISKGTLTPINIFSNAGNASNTIFATGIKTGGIEFDNELTVGGFSVIVMNANTNIAANDTLIFCVGSTFIDGLGFPRTQIDFFPIKMDTTDTTLLSDLIPFSDGSTEGIIAELEEIDGTEQLVVDYVALGTDRAFCVVQAREDADFKKLFSTQTLTNGAVNTIRDQFVSDAQLQLAIESYGYNPDTTVIPV